MTKFKAGDRVILVKDGSDHTDKVGTVQERGYFGLLEDYLRKGSLPVKFDNVNYGSNPYNCQSSWSSEDYRRLTKLEQALA